MKLGTETASVMNHLYSRGTIGQPEPVVGMGVTFLDWTDRRPGTIVQVSSSPDGRAVYFAAQEDDAVRIDRNGIGESQRYEFTPNPKARRVLYKRDRKGAWRQVEMNERGRDVFVDKSQSIRIGERDKYYDFSF